MTSLGYDLKGIGVKRVVPSSNQVDSKLEYEFPVGTSGDRKCFHLSDLWLTIRNFDLIRHTRCECVKSSSAASSSHTDGSQVSGYKHSNNHSNDSCSSMMFCCHRSSIRKSTDRKASHVRPIKVIRICRPSNEFSPAIFDSLYNITTLDQTPTSKSTTSNKGNYSADPSQNQNNRYDRNETIMSSTVQEEKGSPAHHRNSN